MRKITTLVLLMVAVATASLSSAQSVTVQEPRLSLLSVIVSKDDSVVVNVNTIAAIAMHNYRLNGDNLISQVTIDTLGNNTIRFYYIHPAQEISPVDNPGQLASMTRQRITREASAQKDDADTPAVKFPEGTYSHSIEFQIKDLDKLKKFYKTALSVWERKTLPHVKFEF